MQSINKFLKILLPIGVFVIPFLVLFVPDGAFFPFITGKNFAFRVIVEILLAAAVILALSDASYRPKKSYILWSLLALLGVTTLATFAGENVMKSFWSNFERMDGLITQIHIVAYFIVLGVTLKSEQLWKWFIHTSLVAAVFVSIYAFFQLAGKLPIHQSGVRLDATLGNSIYLAVYMVFHIFFAMYFYFKESTFKYRWIYLVLSVLYAVILYHTASRGPILGLIGGVVLTLVLMALFESGVRKKRSLIALGIVALLLVSFLGLRKTEFVRTSPVLSRFAELSLSEQTVKSRSTIWSMATEGFKDNPLLGVGPGNFNLVFNTYYRPEMYSQEPWFDRAHNAIFDWLSSAGILGLIAYLSVFASALLILWRIPNDRMNVLTKSLTVGLLGGYFFQNLFVFDNIISYTYFFTVLAFIHYHGTQDTEPLAANKELPEAAKWTGGAVALAVMLFTLFNWNIQPIQANRGLIDVLQDQAGGQVTQKTIDNAQAILDRETFATVETLEQISFLVINLGRDPNADQAILQPFFALVHEGWTKQLEKTGNDARHQMFFGTFLSAFGFFDEALEHLNIAQELSPNKQAIHFEISRILLAQQKKQEAFELLKEAYELDPSYSRAVLSYAAAAIIVGEDELADKALIDRFGRIELVDSALIDAYALTRRFDRIIGIWEYQVQQNPGEPQAYFSLGASYVAAGQVAKAIQVMQYIVETFPDYSAQATEIIGQLRTQ